MNRFVASCFGLVLVIANLSQSTAQGFFDGCSICPRTAPQLGLPDFVLPTGTVGVITEGMTCGLLEEAAQEGSYSAAVCSIIRLVVSEPCGCFAPPTEAPVSVSPTMAPVGGETDAPAVAPVTDAPVDGPTLAPATDTPTMAPLAGVTKPPSMAPVAGPDPTNAPVVVVTEPTEAPVVVPEPTEAPVVVVMEPTEAPVVGVPEPTEAPVVGVPEPTEAPVVGVPEPTEAPIVGVTEPTEAPVVNVTEPTEAPIVGVPVPTEAPIAVPPETEAPVVPLTEAPVVAPSTVSTNIAVNIGVGEISGDDEEAFARACAAFLQTKLDGASNFTCSIIRQSASSGRRRLQNETNVLVVSITAISDSLDGDDLEETVVGAINGDKTGFIDQLTTESSSGFFDGVTEDTLSAEAIESPVAPPGAVVADDDDNGGLSSGAIAGIVVAVIVGLIIVILIGLWAGKENPPPHQELLEEEEEESIMVHPPPNPREVPGTSPKATIASQFAVQAAAEGAGSMLSMSSADGESEMEGYSVKAPGSTVDHAASGAASVDVVSATSGALSSLRHNMIARTVLIPPGKLGIVVDTTLEGPVVNQVNDASPVQGLLFAGDIIVAVDDVDTRAMSASAIYSLMKKTTGMRRKVTVLSEDVAS